MLADPPGKRRVIIASVDEGGDARQEEYDVEDKIERRLRARPHRAVEKIAAYMGVLRQRVGAGQHEHAAVEHVARIEDPCRRHVHDVTLEYLDADKRHEPDDEPRRGLADPCADAVDRMQNLLDVHVGRRPERVW